MGDGEVARPANLRAAPARILCNGRGHHVDSEARSAPRLRPASRPHAGLAPGLSSTRIEELEGRTLLSTAYGDFNGDGRDDLAIGVPGEDVGGFADAGAVNVLYGSASGLTIVGDQIWHQDSVQGPQLVEGQADAGDRFGAALAVGDFNNDGRDDLAIGVPGEDVGGFADAGAVNVLYGSASGLTAAGDQIWHQDPVQGPSWSRGRPTRTIASARR